MSRTSFSLGDNDSNFTSSSQAAYKKPPTDNLQNPTAKRNQHGTTFSLGPENQDGESNFISSNAASYGGGQPKTASARKENRVIQNSSNFTTTNSSSYGSPTFSRKQKDNQTSSPNNYVGRHATSAARYPSADNVLASFGTANQAQGQGQGGVPISYSSTFITSNAAAYKNPSGSSPSPSRPVNNSNNDNGSNFQSSNSSYGKGTAPNADAPAAGVGRATQSTRAESGNFQIGFSTDSSFATSNSVAFSRPSENKERLQEHNKHSVRSSPVDSDNPLGPSNINQGVLPASSSTTSLSSVSSNNSKNSSNNQNYNSNNNSNQNNQVGRGISEKHKGLQRSSFNPITGE